LAFLRVLRVLRARETSRPSCFNLPYSSIAARPKRNRSRFEDFDDELAVWVMFHGADGGEAA